MMTLSARCVVLVLMLLIMASAHPDDYLYLGDHAQHNIKEYTGARGLFEESIAQPRIVEFYSPLCPACIAFKSTYVRLAQLIRQQHPEVEFYAVSCTDHDDICRKYNIKDIPSMFAFGGNKSEGTIVPKSFNGQYDVPDILRGLDLDVKIASGSVVTTANRKLDAKKGDDDDGNGDNGNGDNDDGAAADKDDDEEEEEAEGVADGTNKLVDTKDKTKENVESTVEAGDDEEEVVGDEPGDGIAEDGVDSDDDVETDENGDKRADDGDVDEVESDINEEEAESKVPQLSPKISSLVTGSLQSPQTFTSPANTNIIRKPIPISTSAAATTNNNNNNVALSGYVRPPTTVSQESGVTTGIGRSAGAASARLGTREHDRFKAVIKPQVVQAKKTMPFKRVAAGSGKVVPKPAAPGATDTMKANTPGTKEYEERQKKFAEIREKILKNRGSSAVAKPGTIFKHGPPIQVSKSAGAASTTAASPISTTTSRIGAPNVNTASRFSSGAAGRPVPLNGATSPRTATKALPELQKTVSRPKLAERIPVVKRMVRMNPDEALILDASLSFLRGLKYGVFENNDPLPGKKKRALQDWLELMSVSLPPEWSLHEAIDDLRDNIDYISQDAKNLEKVLNKHALSRNDWSLFCKKSTEKSNSGFPCGFWKLLHISSVGLAEHRGGLNLEYSSDEVRTFAPMEAAGVIREYMAYFFPCTVCSKHFMAQYDQCHVNRRCDRLTDDKLGATDEDWKEMALWLWEFHNDVSVRLLHEKADKKRKALQRGIGGEQGPGAAADKDAIKVLFPNIEQCVLCFNEDGGWNDNAVFVYLEKEYWPGAGEDSVMSNIYMYESEGPHGPRVFMVMMLALTLLFLKMKQSRTALIQAMLMTKRVVSNAPKKRSV